MTLFDQALITAKLLRDHANDLDKAAKAAMEVDASHGVNAEKIGRTNTDKIHIPARPIGDIQRCERCHARIDINRKWAGTGRFTPSFWKVGVPVLFRRSGATVVTALQTAAFPQCGRKEKG